MALFDKSANDYDGWYQSPMGRYVDTAETACLFALADNIAGKDVLDLGCGTGHLSEMLHARGANVTGIDISDGMLAKARASSKRQGLTIDYINMNVYDLGFAPASFDCVYSMAAVEFIPDTTRSFANLAKVLKPGGSAIIGTIHKDSAWADMYESDAFADTVFAHARFLQRSDFEALDGFDIVDSKECLFVPPGQSDETYTMDNEQIEKQIGRKGGFLCVKMKKL